MYKPLKYIPQQSRLQEEEPEIDCITVNSNPYRRRSVMFDAVAKYLWSVVLGFVIATVMCAMQAL